MNGHEMRDKKVQFTNPDLLPVENVSLTVNNVGVVRKIKALDSYWVEERDLIFYERPPSDNKMVVGAVEAWRLRMEIYLDNLKWLLGLEHYRFWSTVLYHPKCMDMLVSFLQEADPPYILPHRNKTIRELYAEIRRCVLVVFCRLITNRESESEWMTREFMADAVYNNFVFTVPILWDICLVYGVDNLQRVMRILRDVFALQPKYESDAGAAIAFVNEAFKYIILQVNKEYDNLEPPNLPETFKGFGEITRPSNNKPSDKITFRILRDLILHLLDSAMTLRIFIQAYPKSVSIFKKTNFVNSIVQIYEHGVPQLYEKLQELGDQDNQLYHEVEGYLDCARIELIDIFREILAAYKDAIFSNDGNIESHVEDYLSVMMDGLSEKLLIRDYHSCYQVHEDIEMLRQAYPKIDTVKTDFILQAIYSNLEDPVPENLLNGDDMSSNSDSDSIDSLEPSTIDNVKETIDQTPVHAAEESLISAVKDILPHLGDGFILKCLVHYDYNSETVINRILEGNLDESLKGLDQSLPLIPEDPLDQNFLDTGVARLNVFDGDEFDIMTRNDVDVSRIHIGKKKSKYSDLKEMLNDKSDVKKMTNLYEKYSLVYDDEEALYSDEYDDSFEVEMVPPTADTTPDERRRPFVTPRALRGRAPRGEDDSEEEEEEEEEEEPSSSSRNKMDFCVNPEEIRARREASFQARRGRGARPMAPAKTANVVGKPKGQGQEKEVLVSRDKKEKHKSARANHNRRQGAQWKRSQGLMPS